jgi:hypothetical protein
MKMKTFDFSPTCISPSFDNPSSVFIKVTDNSIGAIHIADNYLDVNTSHPSID